MPARVTSRSQQPSQSQRQGRRAAHEDDEDDEERDEGAEEDEDVDMEEATGSQRKRGGGNIDDDSIEKKAHSLVRLALFNECKRMPLRRDEISKKVLGSATRSFNSVFERAQLILRKTFAMELVELMTRAEREKGANANDETEEGRKATGLKKKATVSGSKSYILRSTLDPHIVEFAALTDSDILENEVADLPNTNDEDEAFKIYGSIIAWSSSDQLGALGVLYVILALILVNGRALEDMTLRGQLKRLQLGPTASLKLSAQSTTKTITLDAYLTQLVRQGYLDRQRVGGSTQAGGKRGRASNVGTQEEGVSFEWHWGSRAQAEVGEAAIGRFIAEFMVERSRVAEEEDEEDGGAERGAGGSRGRGKEKKKEGKEQREMRMVEDMMKGLARAAGGALAEVK